MGEQATSRSFLLVDEDKLFRERVGQLLLKNGARAILEASDFTAATDLSEQCQSIVTAMHCNGESCLGLLSRIAARNTTVATIVFLNCDEPEDAIAAVRAGAAAVLSKDRGVHELLTVLSKIDGGEHFIDHVIAMKMIFHNEQARNLSPNLSSNEREILRMLAEGKSMIEIADIVQIAYKTVVVSCTRLKRKLRINDTGELLRFAREYLS